jgi:hypothetical protein
MLYLYFFWADAGHKIKYWDKYQPTNESIKSRRSQNRKLLDRNLERVGALAMIEKLEDFNPGF